MRNVNFIKSSSPSQHRALHLWYHITVTGLTLTIIAITLVSGWQLYTLYNLRSQADMLADQTVNLKAVFGKKKTLEEQLTQVTQKTDYLNELILKNKQTYTNLKAIFDTCCSPLSIHSIRLKNGIEELRITTPTISRTLPFVQHLKKEAGIEHLTITSCEPITQQQNGYLVSIKRVKNDGQNP